MTENKKYHSIISDYVELERFVSTLDPDGKYLVQLTIRNKYADYNVNKNYNVLRKNFLPVKKIIPFIKQLEVPVGAYETHTQEPILNDTGFAVYISVNALDENKAYQKMLVDLSTKIAFNQTMPRHIEEYVHTQLFKSNARSVLDVEFDSDSRQELEDIKTRVVESIGTEEAVRFINTRGGIHSLIETAKIPNDKRKTAIRNIQKLPKVDMIGSQMSHAVPGTFQGGHAVTMD